MCCAMLPRSGLLFPGDLAVHSKKKRRSGRKGDKGAKAQVEDGGAEWRDGSRIESGDSGPGHLAKEVWRNRQGYRELRGSKGRPIRKK